jgi:NAD(P)-dependent dehydrogenase (short-subunit alcohol dehydrogenase family)
MARTVLITGASGGVGIVAAKEFLKQGYNCVLHFNSNNTLQELAKQYPESAFLTQASVTDENRIQEIFQESVDRFGCVDSLVVCHGIWPTEDVGIKDMEYQRWKRTIEVNLDGTFLFVKHYLRSLERVLKSKTVFGPSIVLIGSTAGKFGEAWHCDYACTKTAMMYGMILSLKNEIVKVHPHLRINTVSPGWIRTPMAEKAMKDPSLLYQALASSPLKRVSEPQDIVQAILFLEDSTRSGNITGISLDVNAGMEGRLINQPTDFKL